MRQPKVIVSIQHLGSEPCCLFQIIHGCLELPQSQFAVSPFQVKICAVRSKSQALGGCCNCFSVLPTSRLRFGKLQHSIDILRICCEILAGLDDALVIRQGIKLAPQAGRNFESAMLGWGSDLRRQLSRQAESGHEEKHAEVDQAFPPPPHAALRLAHLCCLLADFTVQNSNLKKSISPRGEPPRNVCYRARPALFNKNRRILAGTLRVGNEKRASVEQPDSGCGPKRPRNGLRGDGETLVLNAVTWFRSRLLGSFGFFLTIHSTQADFTGLIPRSRLVTISGSPTLRIKRSRHYLGKGNRAGMFDPTAPGVRATFIIQHTMTK